MVEFLVASAQALSGFLLIYGAYLVICRGPRVLPAASDARTVSEAARERKRG